jgi:hypothetical protein
VDVQLIGGGRAGAMMASQVCAVWDDRPVLRRQAFPNPSTAAASAAAGPVRL